MSDPGTRAAAIVTLTVTGVSVLVIGLLAFLPAFQPTPSAATTCGPAPGSSESIDGRTYCYQTVPMPVFYANYTLSDFAFGLHAILSPEGSFLVVTITEPSGVSHTEDMGRPGSLPPWEDPTSTWFTPDNAAGVLVFWIVGNVSLLEGD